VPDTYNLLEPAALLDAFSAHAPCGFSPCIIRAGESELIGFTTDYDLTTTLEPALGRLAKKALVGARIHRLVRPRTLFGGTTVSEYLPYPPSADPQELIAASLDQMRRVDARLLILKDIPRDSPLLSSAENAAAARLRDTCRCNGFAIVSGQALAFVRIDFRCEDDFLRTLSRSRRKDLRRKLKTRPLLEIEELPTGHRAFEDDAFLDLLFVLYRNVYEQSLVHFDELTAPFFRAILRAEGGTVFLYRLAGTLIGYNICFVHRDRLVDKYVGFLYPHARDVNLYFVSWVHNLEWARRHGLHEYVAGWTDPEVKRALGARFTFTDHAVYARSPVLRFLLKHLRPLFEADARWAAEAGHRERGPVARR
jgi:predicted N-acyltransferase